MKGVIRFPKRRKYLDFFSRPFAKIQRAARIELEAPSEDRLIRTSFGGDPSVSVTPDPIEIPSWP